jgi:hypothetical protein
MAAYRPVRGPPCPLAVLFSDRPAGEPSRPPPSRPSDRAVPGIPCPATIRCKSCLIYGPPGVTEACQEHDGDDMGRSGWHLPDTGVLPGWPRPPLDRAARITPHGVVGSPPVRAASTRRSPSARTGAGTRDGTRAGTGARCRRGSAPPLGNGRRTPTRGSVGPVSRRPFGARMRSGRPCPAAARSGKLKPRSRRPRGGRGGHGARHRARPDRRATPTAAAHSDGHRRLHAACRSEPGRGRDRLTPASGSSHRRGRTRTQAEDATSPDADGCDPRRDRVGANQARRGGHRHDGERVGGDRPPRRARTSGVRLSAACGRCRGGGLRSSPPSAQPLAEIHPAADAVPRNTTITAVETDTHSAELTVDDGGDNCGT